MKYYEVALVKSARSMTEPLTYSSQKSLKIGEITEAPFRNESELALVVREVRQPSFKTRELGEKTGLSINEGLVKLALWMSEYYNSSIGACFRLMIPTGVTVKRRAKTNDSPVQTSVLPALNRHQIEALRKLKRSNDTSLLYGVTGSGKTRLYMELAKETQAQGKSSIILVPEISLTTQLVKEFERALGRIYVTHSNMTPSQRHKVWENIRSSKEPVVVVGPRSALFSAVNNLGLVVLDEAHDDSYKQTTNPRYDARRVARKLCDLNDAKLVLGSATPSISDMYLAKEKGLVVSLKQPVQSTSGRHVELIDMRETKNSTPFSSKAITAIKSALEAEEQVLVYLNRRGSAPIVSCTNCGWVANCPTCHIPMVLHEDHNQLRCHTCGKSDRLPTSCPECSNTEIVFRGYGTKKIESELNSLFPEAKIMRFDGDSKKKDSMAEMYEKVREGRVDIIVGTQMIAKGLDLPKLNTGIIVSADTGLSLPDYSTNERVFQLIHQVVGRIGRHSDDSYVGIQTRTPKNPFIRLARSQNYDDFYQQTIKERKLGGYPPFRHLLLLTCSYTTRDSAKKAAEGVKTLIDANGQVVVSGPAPAFYERRGSKYRWQLLVKSASRNELVLIAEELHGKKAWTTELDPVSLL